MIHIVAETADLRADLLVDLLKRHRSRITGVVALDQVNAECDDATQFLHSFHAFRQCHDVVLSRIGNNAFHKVALLRVFEGDDRVSGRRY